MSNEIHIFQAALLQICDMILSSETQTSTHYYAIFPWIQ